MLLWVAYCQLPIPERNALRTNKDKTRTILWVAYCQLPVGFCVVCRLWSVVYLTSTLRGFLV